ncbi:MAG: ROK family protein [Candidatus Dormibacteraeota bacterium]|nr:ROK family protein [Candidatus Dormibacteraeota bacterium]
MRQARTPVDPGSEPAEETLHLVSLLARLRTDQASSRADLARQSGLSRATVSQHVDFLLHKEMITETGPGESRGGRRPRLLRFRGEAGYVGAVDLGATSLDVAITDLRGRVLRHHAEEATVLRGPAPVLERAVALLGSLLAQFDLTRDRLWGIGMGVPGPVEYRTGLPVAPPIMPGWSGYPIPEYFARSFACPVFVDNDVNILARGEAAAGLGAGVDNFLFVKVGTGIGAGIVVHGHIYRGSQGCAGDIGHIAVDAASGANVICRCGNVGCLEALAGGAALAQLAEAAARGGQSALLAARLAERGTLTAADIAEMANKGDAWSTERIRSTGHLLGHTLAGLVNFFNPSLVVIGGGLANAGDSLLAAIREAVYRRSLPLATRALRIERSPLGGHGGVAGAAHVVLDELFSVGNLAYVVQLLDRNLSVQA